MFLNNEKLPFILELSGNNQIYLGIIKVIYSVPSSSAVTWYSRSMLLQGRGRSVHWVTARDPPSRMTPRRASVHRNSYHVLCKKPEHSNSSMHLEANQRSCQSWRRVSMWLHLQKEVQELLSAQTCAGFLKNWIFSCGGEGRGHLPAGVHQTDLLFGKPNSVLWRPSKRKTAMQMTFSLLDPNPPAPLEGWTH